MGRGLLHGPAGRLTMRGPARDDERPLVELAAYLEHVESALDAEDWETLEALPWRSPTVALRPEERHEVEALLQRAATVEQRVRSVLGGVRGDLDDLTARRRAARRYTNMGQGGLAGPA